MFLISQIKLIERTQNLKVDLNIELRSTVLFINFYQQEGLWNNLITFMLENVQQKSSHPIWLSYPG